jgi:hypothetical protein
MNNETIIEHDGETWRVLNKGVSNEEAGTVFCHLASTTRGQQQKNGFYPAQICDWVPAEKLQQHA